MCISILLQLLGCGKLKTSTSFLFTVLKPGTRQMSVCFPHKDANTLKKRATKTGLATKTLSPAINSGAIELLGILNVLKPNTCKKK